MQIQFMIFLKVNLIAEYKDLFLFLYWCYPGLTFLFLDLGTLDSQPPSNIKCNSVKSVAIDKRNLLKLLNTLLNDY